MVLGESSLHTATPSGQRGHTGVRGGHAGGGHLGVGAMQVGAMQVRAMQVGVMQGVTLRCRKVAS